MTTASKIWLARNPLILRYRISRLHAKIGQRATALVDQYEPQTAHERQSYTLRCRTLNRLMRRALELSSGLRPI